jgi:DnaJ-class molecular chaperone
MQQKSKQKKPAQQQDKGPANRTGAMSPGDQAPSGTPGTGENLCPVCSGKGEVAGKPCANCEGTGLVIEGIGGA